MDGSRDHYMRMHFNITYPSLPCQGWLSLRARLVCSAEPACDCSVLRCAVLSMDAMDMSGESSAGRGYAINGEIHKIRLNAQGERIGLGEYIPPRRYGFLLGGPRQVHSLLCKGHIPKWWTCRLSAVPAAAGRLGCQRGHGGA